MLKVLKFGGSSLADARQFAKVKSIVEADPARRVVIVSAPGKRFSGDHKITDLLYLCAAHIKYGVSCEDIFAMIRDRYNDIIAECGLHISLDKEFDALWDKMKNGISQDELASRGEYFSARLMAEYLGYEFVDAARWIKFKFDGTVDQDASYAALRSLAEDRKVVIPGFYGVMPDGHIRTFSRGGSDITGALAAAALGADVYENWTDVSGILMADPRIVDDPEPIRRVTLRAARADLHRRAGPARGHDLPRAREKHPAQHPQYQRARPSRHDDLGVHRRRDGRGRLHHRHRRQEGLFHHHHRQDRHVERTGLSPENSQRARQARGQRRVPPVRHRQRLARRLVRQGVPLAL